MTSIDRLATSEEVAAPPSVQIYCIANPQGIWNSYFDPIWGSKYTMNINLRMFGIPKYDKI